MLARIRRLVWVSLAVVLLLPVALAMLSDLVSRLVVPAVILLGFAAVILLLVRGRNEW